jgi:hypothetical protein
MYHLLLIALFLCVSTFSVVKSQEVKVEVVGGTCDPGDSTCVADDVTTSASTSTSTSTSSTQQQSKDDVCFPDGKCFSSIEEAEINYKNKHDEKQSFNMDIRKPTKFGNAQEIALDSNQQQSYITKTLEVLSKSHDYMIEIFKDDTTVSFRKECKLRNDLCE